MRRIAFFVASASSGVCLANTSSNNSSTKKNTGKKNITTVVSNVTQNEGSGLPVPVLPMGTAVSIFGGTSDSPLDGVIVVGGALDLTDFNDAAFGKSSEIRQSATIFAQWLNAERGGLRVGGKRFGLWTLWVDGKSSNTQTTDAMAWSIRNKILPADFVVGGASAQSIKFLGTQARTDNRIMMAVGAPGPGIFINGDIMFGMLPDGEARTRDCFSSIIWRAKMLDANSSLSHPCGGQAGCVAQLTYGSYGSCANVRGNLAETFFPPAIFTEAAVSGASEVRAALIRLQVANVTILHICSLAIDELKFVIEQMADMNFNVFAIIARSIVTTSAFRNEIRAGWWQGGYMLDAIPWTIFDPSSNRGEFSNLTSKEFSSRFFDSFQSSPSFYAAAQYAALCALSAAIEEANSTNTSAVKASLQKMKLQEFYGLIQFSDNVINLTHLVVQVDTNSPTNSEVIVYPPDHSSNEFVFPKPPWAQMRCRHETRYQSVSDECSGHGSCDLEGVCRCVQGWSGASCNDVEVSIIEVATQALWWLFWLAGVLVFGAAAVFGYILKRRREKYKKKYLDDFVVAIQTEKTELLTATREGLMKLGWLPRRVTEHERITRRRVSEESGVSLAYLLSSQFMNIAQDRSKKEDPTFYDLRDAFFFGHSPIGADITCPRDGRLGCSLLDSLEWRYRGPCTHFLSWTWGYKLSTVVSALSHWLKNEGSDPSNVFIYMCFFVNNQYRILVNGETTGSAELEHCFERNLTRIGKVVAVLDTWDNPVYFTRLWTIFEQVVAIKLDIPVTMVLPDRANKEFFEEIERGKLGLLRVKEALIKVDSCSAKASYPEDEHYLKQMIKRTVGFKSVDEHIIEFMIKWVGCEVEAHMRDLMKEMSNDDDSSSSVFGV